MKSNRTLGSSRKKKGVTLAIIFSSIVVVLFINGIPTFNLANSNMNTLEGNWINVYYEQEKSAAEDVFQYADSETELIAQKLGFYKKHDINVYIYDSQNVMQSRKYGLIGPLLGLDWYIGDNIGTDVILTSPANPGPAHSYDDNKYAVLHEIVHAYISVYNSHIGKWLTEGVALYLSNGTEFYKEYLNSISIPAYNDTRSNNPIRFSHCNGYVFANTYIEYLDKTFGWESVLELIKTEDYNACLGKTQKEIYEEWVNYIENYYQ